MDDISSNVAVLVLLSIFSICGTIGNSLVLYIYSHKKERSTAGIFIMCLAGTDLVTCLLIIPYTQAAIYLEYRLKFDVACKIYMFLITCNIPFAAFIMVAIATDRYFCICHPFAHVLTIQRAKVIVLCLLFVASMFGMLTALINGVYHSTQTTDKLINTTYNEEITHSPYFNRTSSVLDEANKNGSNANTSAQRNVIYTESTRTSMDIIPGNNDITYTGICQPNFIIFGNTFVYLYQKIYAGAYLVSFIAVVVLYALIYKSIHRHRAKRCKRKRSSLYPYGVEFSAITETQFTAVTHINPNNKHGSANLENGSVDNIPETQPMSLRSRKHKAMSIKEKTFIANIRTAVMLFVVTIVFLIAFLPAWLMGLRLLEYHQVIFYMYFIYHTANPFIYAFMNKSFRDDLRKVLKCQSMPLVR